MMEVWKVMENSDFLCIESFDDSEDNEDCEVWLGNDKTGNIDTVGVYSSFEEADTEAKKFMRENPNGWSVGK